MSKPLKAYAANRGTAGEFSGICFGSGEIDVKSRLNQPLSAVIPISSSSVAELSTATVRLGSNEDFRASRH